MKKYLTLLFLVFLICHPELKGSGPEPWYGGNTTQLSPCLEDHKEDIEYIRQYLSVSKNDKAKRAELIQKMKSNDSFMGFFSQAITEKKKTGNESKTYKELLSNTDWIKLAEKTCNEIYQVAGEYYIKTIVSDLVSSECASRAAQKAINRFNPLKLYSYGTATLAAITEAWLCATEQDKCKGKDYWTQYSYGVLHAVIEQADLLAMSDVLKEVLQSQYASRMSCLGKESDIKIRAVQETETEETIHQALKCVLGIDVTVTELEQRYALTKSYIEKNWQEPYFRGEATVLISTLIVPTAKGISLIRKGILAKFRKAATFSKEIQTLEALGAAEGKVDEIAKVMKVNSVGKFTLKQIDNYVELATKNKNTTKVMFGMYDNGGPASYIQKAGTNYTYFDMGTQNWNEAMVIVNNDLDEIWKINKKFIENQKNLGKEFWFSHDPFTPYNDQFFAKEINYLIDLGVKDFEKIGDLWKAKW